MAHVCNGVLEAGAVVAKAATLRDALWLRTHKPVAKGNPLEWRRPSEAAVFFEESVGGAPLASSEAYE